MKVKCKKLSRRESSRADADYLYELIEKTMRKYIEATYGHWNAAAVRDFVRSATSSGDFCLVFYGGQCAAAMSVKSCERHIQLEQLFVEPAFQNKKIGTTLVNELIEQARMEGKPIKLRVLKSNPAYKFYENLGFEVELAGQQLIFMVYEV